ncbi:hypothetical protein [uncultured Pseudokineococcus sp.]|nr:hypothetical protein [uncultured Pseudokineococcus sp.]
MTVPTLPPRAAQGSDGDLSTTLAADERVTRFGDGRPWARAR